MMFFKSFWSIFIYRRMSRYACIQSLSFLPAPQSRALAPFWYTPSACPKSQPKWCRPFLCPSQLHWQCCELLSDGHCKPTAKPFRCWYPLWKCKAFLTSDHPPYPPCLPQIACAIQKLLFWTWKNLHKHHAASSKSQLLFFQV